MAVVKSFKDRNGDRVALGDVVNYMAIGKGREGVIEATGRVEQIVKLGYFIEVYTEGRTNAWTKMYLEKAQKRTEITPEEVVQAFRDSDLRPKQGHFIHKAWDGATCGCGLSVMYHMATKQALKQSIGDAMAVSNWANLIYGADYASGFMSGFDGSEPDDALLPEPDQKRGFRAGRKAWAAVVEAGLT